MSHLTSWQCFEVSFVHAWWCLLCSCLRGSWDGGSGAREAVTQSLSSTNVSVLPSRALYFSSQLSSYFICKYLKDVMEKRLQLFCKHQISATFVVSILSILWSVSQFFAPYSYAVPGFNMWFFVNEVNSHSLLSDTTSRCLWVVCLFETLKVWFYIYN